MLCHGHHKQSVFNALSMILRFSYLGNFAFGNAGRSVNTQEQKKQHKKHELISFFRAFVRLLRWDVDVTGIDLLNRKTF